MTFLLCFWEFFKTGLFAIGGGLATIPFLQEMAVKHPDWFTREELTNFIAISESTPGPIAVNMATFVGSTQGGILGSLVATLGVVLPSFIVILLIATFIRNFLKYKGVQAFLGGVRPCVVALILSTALTMLLSTLLGVTTVSGGFAPDVRGIIIFAVLVAIALIFKKIKKKKPSPILMILISAGLGMLVYGV